jgi:hypothetical protein
MRDEAYLAVFGDDVFAERDVVQCFGEGNEQGTPGQRGGELSHVAAKSALCRSHDGAQIVVGQRFIVVGCRLHAALLSRTVGIESLHRSRGETTGLRATRPKRGITPLGGTLAVRCCACETL